MGRLILYCRKKCTLVAVDTVNAVQILFRRWFLWLFGFGLVSFVRNKALSMIFKPNSIAQAKLNSSSRYFGELRDNITDIILHTEFLIDPQIQSTAYCPLESLPQDFQRSVGRK